MKAFPRRPVGSCPRPKFTATPRAKLINNNKSNYHHNLPCSANVYSSERSERDVGSEDLRANQNQQSLPRGRSQGLCYLPSKYESSAALWVIVGWGTGSSHDPEQKYSGDRCLWNRCRPHPPDIYENCFRDDHFITACAGRALSFSSVPVLYINVKEMRPLLQTVHHYLQSNAHKERH